mgnify:CR=1 FL=1
MVRSSEGDITGNFRGKLWKGAKRGSGEESPSAVSNYIYLVDAGISCCCCDDNLLSKSPFGN